jgi:hypothetical protein
MSDKLITGTVVVVMAIIGVALVALIVSKNANTAGVVSAGSQGFGQALSTALSPLNASSNGMIESVSSTFNPL